MKRFYIFLFSAIILFSLSCKKDKDDQIECPAFSKPPDTYIYPIRPGMPEWANMTTEQKFAACEIPGPVLSTLSTEALIQSWLDYPLRLDIFLSSSLQRGMGFFMENSAGLKELTGRSDAGVKLLERYRRMNPSCILNLKKPEEIGEFSFNFMYFKMLFSQETYLNQLSLQEKKLLASEALNKFNKEKGLKTYYGSIGPGITLFLAMKTMKAANYIPFVQELESGNIFLDIFITTAVIPTQNLNSKEISAITDHLKNFIR